MLAIKQSKTQSRALSWQLPYDGVCYQHCILLPSHTCCFIDRKRRKDALDAELRALITEWWESHTTPLNNKNRVLKGRRQGSEPHVVHIKEHSQTKLYLQFKAEHPEVSVKQRAFEKLKPDFIRKLCVTQRLTCCCKDHSHMHLIYSSIKCYRVQQARVTGDPSITLPPRLSQLLAKGLCPPAPEHAAFYPAGSLNCLLGTCSNCSVGRCLLLTMTEVLNSVPAFKLEYYGYQEYTTQNGKVKKRITLLVSIPGMLELKSLQVVTKMLLRYAVDAY